MAKPAAKTTAPANGGIQKKKTQPSRKGKKAWRKNVDITDVEEAQEELRAVERVV